MGFGFLSDRTFLLSYFDDRNFQFILSKGRINRGFPMVGSPGFAGLVDSIGIILWCHKRGTQKLGRQHIALEIYASLRLGSEWDGGNFILDCDQPSIFVMAEIFSLRRVGIILDF